MKILTTGACALALALACGPHKSLLDDNVDNNAVSGDTPSGEKPDKDSPKRSPITPQKLQPVISELGAEGVNPTAIVVSFATPIIERDESGRATSKTKLKIKPDVPGSVTYLGTSQLRFTPQTGFESNTSYDVELLEVETRDGELQPPGNTKWTHSFKTPKFALLGWAPSSINERWVTMELTFSAPVLPNVALAQMAFTVDGAPITGVQVLPARGNSNPHIMTVQLNDPRIKVGANLGLALKENLLSIGGAKAPSAKLDYKVTKDQVISIKGAQFVEGSNGYYLEVSCDDKAAAPGHRSAYYEGEYASSLSERCQLSEDAISKVVISPPVDKPYITSGKSGFRVFGNFKRGVYRIKIDAGARSVDGGVVTAPFSRSYAVAARKAQLGFVGSGRYLPRVAWTNLGMRHLNVEEVNLVVRQVPPENLVFWLGNAASDAADDRTSNVILKKTLPLRSDADTQTTSWQDVSQLLPSTTRGVLELKLAGVGTSATSRILLTDLSLVAKKSQVADKPWLQTVKVWALDMQTSELLDGVEVQLVRKSGKVVATCNTDGEAGCTLDAKPGDPDEAEPFAVIARKGDDLTYIRYQDLKADVSESSVSGQPYVSPAPYRAAIYGDRGVYRPGETAHVIAIVRDAKDRAPDQAVPVDVKIYDPKAKVVKKLTVKTNPGGVVAIDHQLPAYADTGHWRVQLEIAEKPLIAHDIQVEEFVPERMKVEANAQKLDVLIGEKMLFDVSARYLFGGTAMDSGVHLTCTVEPTRFAPTENGDYTYGIVPKGKEIKLGEEKSQLDPAGKVAIACPAGTGVPLFTQTMSVTAQAAVEEAGSGRTSVDSAFMTLHPAPFYIGVKTKAAMVSTGNQFTVEGILVDWEGKPVANAASKLEVELAHLEADYGYAYDEETGEASYDRHTRHVPEGRMQVAVDPGGKFHFDVTPGDADLGYVVRVKAGKAETHLVLDGVYPYEYYSDYGDRVDSTPRPAKPTKVTLDLPKDLEVGKAATVKTRAPYRGKMLWTVETDRVIKAEWVDVQAGETSWSFTLDKFAPNVYVSALLVKDPHLESKTAFLPDRAFGVGSARVTPTQATQKVTLTTPKEVRSSSPLSVTLDVGPVSEPTFATIAVVDEGVLSLTRFQTPDPNSALFAKRALGVETFETIGWTMLHQPAGASSKTGGGDEGYAAEEGGALDGGRVQPTKIVAMFSGVVQVGADGKLTVPFQLPNYRGQVRVMAFTMSPTKVGRAEAKVIVKDPLVVQMTFPRFVTHEDQIMVPVFLTNVSGGTLEVSLKLESSVLPVPGIAAKADAPPPIAFAGKDKTTIKLDNGRAETIVFAARAAVPIGAANVRVVATVKGAWSGTLVDDVNVPFLPAGPRDRTITKVQVQPGKLDLGAQAALKGWVPTTETTTFWLTSNPYGESFEHLKYLIHYPYGCIEQTTSSTRPLLYVAALAEQLDTQLQQMQIQDMVLAGIARVLSMQTPAGGFSYWPGGAEPDDWGTAYATHMLLDAKAAGYAVPDDRLKEALKWIDTQAAAYERGLGKYGKHSWAHYDGQVQAYFHYVLAIAGKGKKARVQKLISEYTGKLSGEELEDLYMLKAALHRAGDHRYEADLKAVDTSPISAERSNYWSYYSDRRRRGMQLSIFFDLFKNDPAGEPLAQRVAQGLVGQTSWWYTTQELVWGITGLGKWVTAQAAKGTAGGTLTADGQTIAARSTKTKTNDKTWVLHRASEYKQLAVDIPQSAANMWLVIRSEGVRAGATYKTGGNGLIVSRQFRKGDTLVDPSHNGEIQLGDVLTVEVEIRNSTGAAINNIALVDRLPAGFEIENPRLGRGTPVRNNNPYGGMPDEPVDADGDGEPDNPNGNDTQPDTGGVRADQIWAVDFQNLRDDRVEAFGSLPATTTRKIVYTVRAVTSGKFTIPPVEAEAMYDPTLWARAAGGTAIVGGPWTGKTI